MHSSPALHIHRGGVDASSDEYYDDYANECLYLSAPTLGASWRYRLGFEYNPFGPPARRTLNVLMANWFLLLTAINTPLPIG